jgi:putative membrane protein
VIFATLNSSPRPYHYFLLFAVLAVLVWSGIGPYDRVTWVLEVSPTVVGLIVLLATWRRFRFTDLTLTLIALHMILLCVGGKYTYARVPLGDWVKDALHLARNHYDRVGHLAQGFVPALIAREILLRLNVVARRAWVPFLVVSICLGISAVYELLEWVAALVSREASESFLGTQGDNWDTQADMAWALAGAVAALFLFSRWQDRQIRALENTGGSA